MTEYTIQEFSDKLNAYWDEREQGARRVQDVAIPALGLVGEASEVTEHLPGTDLTVLCAKTAEQFKKHIRDGKPLEDNIELAFEFGDVLHYWCRLVRLAGFTPGEIMELNEAKLAKRRAEKTARPTYAEISGRSFEEFRESLAPLNASPEHTLDTPIEVGDGPNGNGGW